MTIEEAHRLEMLEYAKSAIYYLELALNVIECDDRFNNGQSEMLNNIYDKSSKVIKELESLLRQ